MHFGINLASGITKLWSSNLQLLCRAFEKGANNTTYISRQNTFYFIKTYGVLPNTPFLSFEEKKTGSTHLFYWYSPLFVCRSFESDR